VAAGGSRRTLGRVRGRSLVPDGVQEGDIEAGGGGELPGISLIRHGRAILMKDFGVGKG
jgi:hypothetical protein